MTNTTARIYYTLMFLLCLYHFCVDSSVEKLRTEPWRSVMYAWAECSFRNPFFVKPETTNTMWCNEFVIYGVFEDATCQRAQHTTNASIMEELA